MLVALKSPVKFSKKCFLGVKFEVVLQKQFLSVFANHSKSDFCTVNWVAFSKEIHSVYSSDILSNTGTIREVYSTEINSVWLKIVQRETHRITSHYSAELQTAKQILTTSKIIIEFTYGDFPCHLKMNRNKPALINRRSKCKKGERLTITANSFKKIDQLDGFRPL